MTSRGAFSRVVAVVLVASMVGASLTLAGPTPTPAAEEAGPGVIRGSLVDANGQPLTGYRVRVTDAAGNAHESETTGPEGKYEIGGLAAGTYTYTILDPEGNPVSMKIPPVNLEAGTVVTQPIAIVPQKGKGPLVAWLVGSAAVIAALLLAADNDDDDDEQMTSTRTAPGPAL